MCEGRSEYFVSEFWHSAIFAFGMDFPFFLSFFLQSVYLGVRIASRGGLPHSESFTGEAREIPECAYACRFERGKMSRMKINREIFDWNEPVLNTVPRIEKERKEKRRIGLNKQSG